MRLKEKYTTEVIPNLVKQFDYTSVMQAPKVEKVVINMGLGDAISNSKILEDAVAELTLISGQKPVREGMDIGCKVTLRGPKMYDFLERLVRIALPRVRDFRGINPGSFDGRGNYTMGVKEQLIFPEIDYDKVNKVRGMDITVVTSAKTDAEGHALLTELGFPFKKESV